MSSATASDAPVNIESLIQELTVDEKVLLLAGKNVWETYEIDRLEIPSLKLSDGPNGVRGEKFYDGPKAACFPACVSLAATFNPDIALKVGKALGEEAHTKGAGVVLGPTVCGHRSPLGGRNFEAFSEDPLLSGLLATEYVKGLQSERVAATVKHYVANEQDTRRFSVRQTISERTLREIYLRPFEIVVKNADPWAFMTSYPRVNGVTTDSNRRLLQDVLRDQWGYQGFVMSDWAATTTQVDSVNAGLDLEMPGPAKWRVPEVVRKAVDEGKIPISELNNRTRALLQLLVKTGKFSDRRERVEEKAVDLPEHRELIRKAGGEGVVLLKNTGVLPLNKDSIKTIAVVGPLAKYASAHGGGSASLNSHYKTSLFDALSKRLTDTKILYSKGTHIFNVYPDITTSCTNKVGEPGFTAEFFKSRDFSGEPFHVAHYPRSAFSTLTDVAVEQQKSVRFTSTYVPEASGSHYLSFSCMGPGKFWIDDVLVAEQEAPIKDSMSFVIGVQDEIQFRHSFTAGQSYKFHVETKAPEGSIGELYLMDGLSAAHIGLITQVEMETDLLAESIALAQQADLTILCVGRTDQWETEGADMSTMSLPANGSQDRLIKEISSLPSTKTVVVNSTGGPVCTPWIDSVDALVQGWYAGQETGNAVLDVILGELNPSGKLPMSWPKEVEHCASFGNFGLDSFESRKVEYVEGVHVGYRDFDRKWGTEKEVRFPFGFGLSYTTFEVQPVGLEGKITKDSDANKSVVVKAQVKNTGDRQGKQVVQVYIAPPAASSASRPPKSLVGWAKVDLEAGETKEVDISFKRDGLAYWDEAKDCWAIESGAHKVLVGTSSDPKDLKDQISLDVEEAFTYSA